MARVKDNASIITGLAPNMQGFAQKLYEKFPSVVYTSGKRDASQKVGTNYKHSHHNTGNALDISGQNKEVFTYLTKDPEGQALMQQYGYELIDETDPETMKRTGATGPHYHIEPAGHVDHTNEQPVTMPAEREYNPFKVVQPTEVTGSFVDIASQKLYTEAKEEESDARQAVKEVQTAKAEAVQQALPEYATQDNLPAKEPTASQMPEWSVVDLQQGLPTLPKYFQMPTTAQ